MTATLGIYNRTDEATLTGGSWVSTLPRDNLKTKILGQVARTTDAAEASSTFTMDLAEEKKIQVASLVNHNISLGGKVRIRASNEPAAANLLTYPRNFDNAVWQKTGSVINPNTVLAPDGIHSADKLIEDTGVSTTHFIVCPSITVAAGTYTTSFFIKAGERSVVSIHHRHSAASNYVTASFDLSSGTISAPAVVVGVGMTSPSASITPFDDGWYRCSVTGTHDESISAIRCWVRLRNGGTDSYTGDGTSGVYLWHAQLETGSVATSVIPDNTTFVSRSTTKNVFNSSGVLSQVAINVAATDYDPVTLVSKGVSLEAAAINGIRNNTMAGAVAGSPGTMPTNWFVYAADGLTSYVIGTGNENGIDYIDVRCTGTATANTNFNIRPETLTGVVASSGQTWTASMYFKMVGGSYSGVNSRVIVIDEYTGAGAYVTGAAYVLAARPTSSSNLGMTRDTATRTFIGGGTVARAVFYHAMTVLSGGTVDITVRVGLPQLEEGSFATSPIKTTGTAITRGADISSTTSLASRASVATYFDSIGVLNTAAVDVGRIGYDPITLANQGQLFESASTNHIPNNTAVGAVAGTPGTLPTGWSYFMPSGSTQIVGTGVESGIEYCDIRFTGSGWELSREVLFCNTTSIVASSGQSWTSSFYVKSVGGLLTNVDFINIITRQHLADGTLVSAKFKDFTPTISTLRSQRITDTVSISATTQRVSLALGFESSSLGGAYDFTLRIGLPQLEQGTSATSVIKTATAAATRAADITASRGFRLAGAFDQIGQTYTYDSGELAVWPAVYDTEDLDWEDSNFWSGQYSEEERTGYTTNVVHLLTSTVLSRYWKVDVIDSTNTDGYIQLGRVFIGPTWTPERDAEVGLSVAWETNTQMQKALNGTKYFQRRTPYRVTRFVLQYLGSDEAMTNAFEIDRRTGIDGEVLWIQDSEDTLHAIRRRYLGNIRELNPIEFPYANFAKKAYTIDEIV